MANDDRIALLKMGVDAWNAWRDKNPDIRTPALGGVNLTEANLSRANLSGARLYQAYLFEADLSEADLSGADLSKAHLVGANLRRARLSNAHLSEADLWRADLSGADLREANLNGARLRDAHLSEAVLSRADLRGANLSGAQLDNADLSGALLFGDFRGQNLSGVNLSGANLNGANLSGANLSGANLSEAFLHEADLREADLREADLSGADLMRVHLREADLSGAVLSGAVLVEATLIDTDFSDADLTGCRIHGVSAWGLKLERTKQQNLVITPANEPEITVDNIEVAQFIYLMLHNEKVRDVIDTITSKAVLILGRFTDERKAVLDAIREELRKHNYLPILFDFDKPASQDLTATVSTLAHLARFIIADLTDPSSIPHELATIVPTTPVPVQPILLSGSSEFAMFRDLRLRHPWVLTTYHYDSQLIADLGEKVIAPAEAKVEELGERRRMIEAELTKPQ